MLGLIGEIALLTAFVACVASGLLFARATTGDDRVARRRLQRYGRASWLVMMGAVAVAAAVLWTLLFGRDFSYAYPFQHTSHAMPWKYTFSAFWAGQEGSFLLWILMMAAAGGAVLWWFSRRHSLSAPAHDRRQLFEAPVMAVLALCQMFLLSMVVGLQLGPLAIGASPFISTAAKFADAPFLAAGGIPADGQGLNDLLQNPWMVIHPPTLFVGFTLMAIPFAFAVAGLWQRRYTQWVRPALPWTLAACGVLGLGIMMGGYWAYVTLSFGGWWAWDPVENSSLVPWLFGVAALHAMVVQKRTSSGHKAAFLLTIAAFAFVVYSTFLTRSGILGDTSVHSFVDLGLYTQLLVWIASIAALGVGFFVLRYRELPAPATPPATLSRESLVFTGALLLALTGFVIILGTSAPIFGRLFRDNPSAVPIAFYNAWTLPLAIGIAFLAGIGQLFWWRTMRIEDINRVLLKPLALTVASTAAVLLFTPFVQLTTGSALRAESQPALVEAALPGASFLDTHGTSLLLLFLLFCAFFALYGNTFVLWRVARGNPKLAGGSLSHVGFGLVLLGIFSSSVFNTPLRADDPRSRTDIQGRRDNFVVPLGQTVDANGYQVTYTGQETNTEGRPVYVLNWKRGDHQFTTRNVVYRDGRGQWIQHPFVRERPVRDLYVALYPSAMSEQPASNNTILLERGAAQRFGDRFIVSFEDYDLDVRPADFGVDTASVDLAVGAQLTLTDSESGESRRIHPVYLLLEGGRQEFIQATVPEWSLTLTFAGMQVEQNAIRVVVDGATVTPEEWVVVQAAEKPFISILWLGTIVLLAGFALSTARRLTDARR